MSSSSYPRSDRPTLQRRPLTAPAPIRPLCATATATTMTPAAVLKPHPLRRAVSHSTAPTEDAEGSVDDAAAAAEELREIVANLSLQQQQLRRPPDTESHSTAAAAVAVRRSSPSTSSSASSSYLNRALPRTPSRGSRNSGGGVGVPLKRKASLGGGGAVPSSVPELAPMQVESTAGTGDEVDSLWATPRNDKGRRRDTPPWIGLDGKRYSPPSRAMTRNPFLRQTTTTTTTSSSALGLLPPHPQIVRAATEPVLPLPSPSALSKLSTKT